MGTIPIESPSNTQTAAEGVGFLLQRQYTGVIERANVSAKELIELLLRDITLLVPRSLAKFSRPPGLHGALKVGDELHIQILMAGKCSVRVIEITPHSFTLLTLSDHPEAGRISFAVRERDDGKYLDLRIRSRARSGSIYQLLGYLFLGKVMQTRVWIQCIKNAAFAAGGNIVGKVQVHTMRVDVKTDDAVRDAGSTFETFF